MRSAFSMIHTTGLGKSALLAAALLLPLGLGTGCSRSKSPDMPRVDEEAQAAAVAPVNLLDKDLKNKVAADIAQRERLPDGRLRAKVNLRNSTKKDLEIEARAVFKNFDGLSTGDETEWTRLFFSPQQMQTYVAESRETGAEYYTIEVRLP